KLGEVLEIADRITVLRRGKRIDSVPAAGATEPSLARMMVGRDVLLRVEKKSPSPGDPLLQVEGLEVLDDRQLPAVRGVSFEVRAGEIVGIAGVDGNGQSELIDGITGLRRPAGGTIRVAGREVAHSTPRLMLDLGVGHIPEDRQRRGLVLEFLISEFDVRGGGPHTPAGALSGGNQQKLVAAREVARDPKVLVAAQPTRGLDVGAIEYLHRRLVEERDKGRAILLISLELDEVLSLSDRILV